MPAGVTFTALEAGSAHNCAVGSDQNAYCWGRNTDGQIGDGVLDLNARRRPTLVAPPGAPFVAVTAGFQNSCGLTTTGTAFCWGNGDYGMLGNGSGTTRPFVGQPFVEHAPVPVTMPSGESFTGISTNNRITCASSTSGTAYCWGNNAFGQLGDGYPLSVRQVPFP